MYNWTTLLYTWNNIVNQLYYNRKWKLNFKKFAITYYKLNNMLAAGDMQSRH